MKENNNNSTLKKIQKHEIVTYQEHFKDPDEIRILLDQYKQIKRYALILHDKDIDEVGNLKKPHFHVLLDFSPQTAPVEWSASLLKVGNNNVNRVKNWNAAYNYLTHKNDPNKYQYDKTLIISNYDHTEPERVDTIDELIMMIATGQLRPFEFSNRIDPLMYVGNKRKLEDAYLYFLRKVRQDMTRQIEVVFLTGATQTGKTTFAKWLCKSQNLSYAVSSDSNDPLQDYEGQDVLILDDIRDNDFKYSALLKITDNHTNSSTKSRYSNKLFVGTMIIMTSSIPLAQWYATYRQNNKDDIDQLITRISAYIQLTDDFIFSYEGQDLLDVAKGKKVALPKEKIQPNTIRQFYKERSKHSPKVRQLLDKMANDGVALARAIEEDHNA